MTTKKAQPLLDELWYCRDTETPLQRGAGPLLADRAVPTDWELAGTRARYAWIYHRDDDATALMIDARPGSCLLQGNPGQRRSIAMSAGIAKVWTPRGGHTVTSGDRIWLDFEDRYVIYPLGNEVIFEFVAWPITSGHPLWAGVVPPASIDVEPRIRA